MTDARTSRQSLPPATARLPRSASERRPHHHPRVPSRAQEVTAVLDDDSRQPLEQSHPARLFAAEVKGRKLPLRYRLDVTYDESGRFPIDDPYRFLPTLGELDLHLVGEGRHEDLWAQLGAHVRETLRARYSCPDLRER